jgi:hypothetical protein
MLFDLSKESSATRERYGRTQFGQRLLLARRLVEAGVPFVTATDFEWDDHSNIFPSLKHKLPVVDRGLSTLPLAGGRDCGRTDGDRRDQAACTDCGDLTR